MNSLKEALENLQVIRETMERSTTLTSVSGRGLIAMGIVATVGAFVAPLWPSEVGWLYTWVAVAVVGCSTGIAATWHQSVRIGPATTISAGRRFGLALAPPIIAGSVFTDVFLRQDRFDLMPGMWMLLYGAGIITAGAFSIRLIPVMGTTFMVLGAVGLYFPDAWFQPMWGQYAPSDVYLALGFGGVHAGFGWVVAARYNG